MAFKALEGNLNNLSDLDNIIDRATRRFSDNERRSFARTVQTWKRKPAFKVFPSKPISRGFRVVAVGPNADIYRYVSRGTKPHVIRPKGKANGGADRLRFQTGYTAKTKPGRISAGSGGKFGPTVYHDEVMHPGIEARDFEGQIRAKADERWQRAVQTEIDKYLKRKGL